MWARASAHARPLAVGLFGVALRVLVAGILGACAARPPAPPVVVPPPPVVVARRAPVVPAARRPVVHTYFDVPVTDDYEWLEDAGSPETQAFTDAQNALTRSTLDGLPERAAVKGRLTALASTTSPDWTSVRPVDGHVFALKDAPPKQQRLLVDLGTLGGSERVVVDPNQLDPSGKTAIDFFVPSPDGRLVAVSLSTGGSESGDVHVFDVATGKDRGETIARVNGGTAGGSVAWNTDATGFFYTRYPRTGERAEVDLDFYQQVWSHKLGTPDSADTYAMGKDLPRIAEIELARSDDGKRILARVSNGDGGEVEHHVLDAGKWSRLTRFEDEVSAAAFAPDGRIYAVSRKGAPRGKIVVFAPPFEHATEVIPEGDAVVETVVVTKAALFTVEIVDGPSRVRRFPLETKAEPLAREPKKATKKGAAQVIPTTITPGARGLSAAVLPLPPVSSVTGTVRLGEDLLLRVESYVDAPRWLLYRSAEHRLAATPLAKKPAYDMSDIEVTRVSCSSRDGTRVPMTVLSKGGRTGPAPGLLTGYGGFDVTVRPRMRTMHRIWLDAGGIVAEANLRGGGERGEAWHRAGNLLHKQNVFDDFAGCARALFDRGYTRPDRLAITGRSNGGLLMGAELVQHPEMFRAVAAGVGIYDMLRTELSPNGAFNVTEYGSVKDEAQFRALRAYSPFHNVKDEVAYPAVLFLTGANDPRVDPYHSRKMTARLQAASSATDRPILLRASNDTGHGMGTPLAAEIEESTDLLTFLLHEVGAKLP